MFLNYLHKGLPKCKNCIYYIPGKQLKSYELGKCKRFGKPYIYTEIARMDDLRCSMHGLLFKKSF